LSAELKGQRLLLAARVAEDDGANLAGVPIVFADDRLLGGHRLRKLTNWSRPARDAIVDFVRCHR
jgi:hypothetical protein